MQKCSCAALTVNGDVWVPVAVCAMGERQLWSLQSTRLCSKGVFNHPCGRQRQPELGWNKHGGKYCPASPTAIPTPLQELPSEYILGVVYRAYPAGHGELGWAP